MRHRGRDRGWFLYSEGRNVGPLPLYKQGKQGQFAHLAGCHSNLRNLRRSPPLTKPKESSAPPPIATSITTPSTFPTTSAMAPKADKGKGVKSAEAQRLAALRKERAIFTPSSACRS